MSVTSTDAPWLSAIAIGMFGALAGQATAVLADPPASGVDLQWAAPPECPSAETVRSAVTRNASGALLTAHVVARAAVTRRPRGGYVALLRIQSAAGSGERRLEARRCEELGDAVALIVALAIHPDRGAPVPESVGDGLGVSAGSSALTSASPEPAMAASEIVPREVLSPAKVRDAWPAAAADASPSSRALGVSLLGIAESGPLPAPAGGMALALSYRRRHVLAEAQAVALAPRSAEIESGVGGHFTLLAALGRACVEARIKAFGVAPCAGLELDRLYSKGFGVIRPSSRVTVWASPSLGGNAVFWLKRYLNVRVGADAGIPLARPSFVLDGVGTVLRPAPAFGRVSFGAEILLF